RLALHEDAGIRRDRRANLGGEVADRRRASDEITERRIEAALLPEPDVLGGEARLQLASRLDRLRVLERGADLSREGGDQLLVVAGVEPTVSALPQQQRADAPSRPRQPNDERGAQLRGAADGG